MIIRSMTATFGKLEGQTLTLTPGLNVITAPNEWGKSTWCAFLLAMLYGIDTRQRSRQGQLPDKERYRPWSGKPMSGSMDILWQGRAITIQRLSRGRTPMGQFSAFETDTGLPVEALTADNCGQRLLGVERSVYLRGGFLRGGDLPVSRDEALNQRLNQLVTTGDDSPAITGLENRLRELKNKCQYNKSGALPQARQALAQCRSQLQNHESLAVRRQAQADRAEALEGQLAALQRHSRALARQEALEKAAKVEAAKARLDAANQRLDTLTAQCQALPPEDELNQQRQAYRRLQAEIQAVELEAAMALPEQEPVEAPLGFAGCSGEAAQTLAAQAGQALARQIEKPRPLWIAGAAALAVALILALILTGWAKAASLLPLVAGLALCCLDWKARRQAAQAAAALENTRRELRTRFGTENPEEIARTAADYARAMAQQQAKHDARRQAALAMAQRRNQLQAQLDRLGNLEDMARQWTELADARRTVLTCQRQYEDLAALAPQVPEPEADELTLTPEETRLQLRKTQEQLDFLRGDMAREAGQAAALPDRQALEAQGEALEARVAELEQWQAALDAALSTLAQAKGELQSRFAPQITGQARQLLAEITGGRYTQLLLDPDFALAAKAEDEAGIMPVAWRSDGTADQMYLALRLAVSQALTPQAPLVLDDALTRFDGQRLSRAMALLAKTAAVRQVILFSCQDREAQWQAEAT